MSNLDYSKAQVYFRGKYVPFSQANVSIASSPVLYGLSIYTVFNVIWNDKTKQLHAFRLFDHWQRLVNSAKIMDFADFAKAYPYDKFEQIMLQLLKKNNVHEDVLVRVTIFVDELIAGTKIYGLKNSMSAYVYPMGEILPRSGVNLCVSSWVRVSDNMIPSRVKVNGQYVNSSLIKNEAIRNGYDDAIALDHEGHVTEGTVANLFFVRHGKLVTPDMSADILEGITRNTVQRIAEQLGIEHEQRTVDRTELYIADEMFICGGSAHITPVLSLDKRTIGNGKIGLVTQQISDYYKRVQKGEENVFSDWLTQV